MRKIIYFSAAKNAEYAKGNVSKPLQSLRPLRQNLRQIKKTVVFVSIFASFVSSAITTTLEYEDLREAQSRAAVSNEVAAAVGACVKTNHTGNVKIKGGLVQGDGYGRARGQYATALGEYSYADAYASFTLGTYAQARSGSDYAFVFNGDEDYPGFYQDHGAGTFNINPVGGVSGFYIGSQTIGDIIDGRLPDVYTKAEIDAAYGALAGVFQRDTSIGVTNLHANGKIVINANTFIASATGRFGIDRRYAYLDHDGMGIYDVMGRGFYVRTNGIIRALGGITRTYRWPSADSGTFALDADIADATNAVLSSALRGSAEYTDAAVANYKPLQEAKSSPAAAATEAYQFVDTISQDANGVITATKKTMRKATTSAPGMVQLNDNLDSTRTDHAATANAVRKGVAAAEAYTDAAIRERSLGGIWDEEMQVWWTPVMSNGSLTYYATTNVNLNAEN